MGNRKKYMLSFISEKSANEMMIYSSGPAIGRIARTTSLRNCII